MDKFSERFISCWLIYNILNGFVWGRYNLLVYLLLYIDLGTPYRMKLALVLEYKDHGESDMKSGSSDFIFPFITVWCHSSIIAFIKKKMLFGQPTRRVFPSSLIEVLRSICVGDIGVGTIFGCIFRLPNQPYCCLWCRYGHVSSRRWYH